MTHIANCMRPPAGASSPVYITMETSFLSSVSAFRITSSSSMNYHLPRRSKSLKNLQADEDPVEPVPLLEKSPSTVSPQPQSGTASRYQLWPSKSPAVQSRPTFAFDKLSALSVGRSSSSLSDTVVSQETVPFWQRSGSLARRRKVSVPELGNTMTTVQEMPLDSRKNDSTILHLRYIDTKQPPSLDGHPCAKHRQMSSAMKDPAVLQAQTGGPVLLAVL